MRWSASRPTRALVGAIDLDAGDGGRRAAVIDMPLDVLLGKPPKMHRDVRRRRSSRRRSTSRRRAAARRLRRAAPSDGREQALPDHDRRPHGRRPLSSRDPMVGPWQVPVADCAVTLADYRGFRGEAMAIGERTPLAASTRRLPAGWRSARRSPTCSRRRSSSNGSSSAATGWPPAATTRSRRATTRAVRHGARGRHRALPGARHQRAGRQGQPVDAHALARGRCGEAGHRAGQPGRHRVRDAADVRPALTPQLQPGDTTLVLIDLGNGRRASAARCWRRCSASSATRAGSRRPATAEGAGRRDQRAAGRRPAARVPRPQRRRTLGGGLRDGVRRPPGPQPERRPARPPKATASPTAARIRRLEELGRAGRRAPRRADLARAFQRRARRRDPGADRAPRRSDADAAPLRPEPAQPLHRQAERARRRRGLARCEGGVQRAAARPAPDLGRGQLAHLRGCATTRPAPMPSTKAAGRADDPGLHVHVAGRACDARRRAAPHRGARPKVAILREQGVNSHVELSYAMDQAGFDTYDVHMTDLQAGRARLDQFQGFVACGGFSYGDTLGAGEGWARSILFNAALADRFAAFFARADSFALGICNGCQMMAALADDDSRRRRVAALHAQQERAVRGPPSVWSRCCRRRRSSCRRWPAAGCRSRSPTGKASPTSRSAATRRASTRALRLSTTVGSRPKAIRRIRTAAPAA